MFKIAEVPAEYTTEDPLDIAGMHAMVEDLNSEWWMEDRSSQRQAIANAFRVAIISPKQNLKWNSIVYQDLMHLPPESSDPNLFESTIKDRKEKWDNFGQMTIDLINSNIADPEWIDYGPKIIEKYMPGIWGNIRSASSIGNHVEPVRQAALEDLSQGGDGRWFRQKVMDMGIPGVGPKVASFAWLLLAPTTSQLATLDSHMMKVLGKTNDAPLGVQQYHEFEKELDTQRKNLGYTDVPLGVFQWASWDANRTPGYHQDHTALRPLNPIDWRNIDWTPQLRTKMPIVQEEIPGQEQLPVEEEVSIQPTEQVDQSQWQPQMGWMTL